MRKVWEKTAGGAIRSDIYQDGQSFKKVTGRFNGKKITVINTKRIRE